MRTDAASGQADRSVTRARRARPPERYSPEQRSEAQRQSGGSRGGSAAGPPPKRSAQANSGSPRRTTDRETRSCGARQGKDRAALRPSRRGECERAGPAPRLTEMEQGQMQRRDADGSSGPTAAGDPQRPDRGQREQR